MDKYNTDLGFPYMSFGDYLGDIRKEPALNIGNLGLFREDYGTYVLTEM